jgi:hypothetical protein
LTIFLALLIRLHFILINHEWIRAKAILLNILNSNPECSIEVTPKNELNVE